MLQGYPDKQRIIRMLEENSEEQAQLQQLKAQTEEMAAKIKEQDDLIRGLEGEAVTQGGAARAQTEPAKAGEGKKPNHHRRHRRHRGGKGGGAGKAE